MANSDNNQTIRNSFLLYGFVLILTFLTLLLILNCKRPCAKFLFWNSGLNWGRFTSSCPVHNATCFISCKMKCVPGIWRRTTCFPSVPHLGKGVSSPDCTGRCKRRTIHHNIHLFLEGTFPWVMWCHNVAIQLTVVSATPWSCHDY